MKSTVFLSLLALCCSTVLAQAPPACLLAAVNTEPNPADLGTICGSDALKVQKVIQSMCGSNVKAAQSAFLSTCSSAGKTVAPYTATSSSSSSGSSTSSGGTYIYTTAIYNSSCSCTQTIVTSHTGSTGPTGLSFTTGAGAGSTGTTGGTGTATQTGIGASSTGGASPNRQQGGVVGSFAAAVIAVAGAVLVL